MYKQVIIIRKDLKMRRGKEIAQGAHASMAFLKEAWEQNEKGAALYLTNEQAEWFFTHSTKVTLQVDSEKELLDIYLQAKAQGLSAHIITDAGFTEFKGVHTKTAVAIGPDDEDRINEITGPLKLY